MDKAARTGAITGSSAGSRRSTRSATSSSRLRWTRTRVTLDAVGEPVEGIRALHEQPAQRPELREGQGAAPCTEALEDREGAAQPYWAKN